MAEGDSLAPQRVEPLLTGRLGQPYLFEQSCGSTQELLQADLPEGALAVCDEQTEGRGRLGRTWTSPPGTAILCSVLLRPPPERVAAELSLVAGTAVAEALEVAVGLAVQVKWPNDVMLNRRKVAGILAEASEGTVVVGIGVNVNQERTELPENTQVAAASLYTIDGVKRDRAPLLAAIVERLERNYDAWLERGLDGVYDSLGSRDFLRGRRVTVEGSTGVGVAIDRSGRFVVDLDGEKRVIESGEILFER
ncbi:MAG TPA: biotin--[acetyl-CoA-carboxylase] ligase [Gaiellaceae bacterium]|nr:biotin--[acetyl-CoA-carboxylase] ligase [Gaiellaceae bacterium]